MGLSAQPGLRIRPDDRFERAISGRTGAPGVAQGGAQRDPPLARGRQLTDHFVRRDTEGFGPALVEALKLHKTYWTLTEEREKDIDGSIALGPLAIACLAYDGGFPIEVESEYLPNHLLQRSWLGEFPT